MNNMRFYDAVRECPPEALKEIGGGKLKGMSDINPMWRIKRLTDLFGPAGEGWKTENVNYWTEAGAPGEVIAFCSLDLLWRKEDGEWSDPVSGIGGSMLVNTEKGNLVSNDEAFKMAKTDAISVACKELGFGADVYWSNDRDKYTAISPDTKKANAVCFLCGQPIEPVRHDGTLYSVESIVENSKKTYGNQLCWTCMKQEAKRKAEAAK